jgi:hypothetical protein
LQRKLDALLQGNGPGLAVGYLVRGLGLTGSCQRYKQ